MTYDTLRLATDPRGVATLTLNRPDKRNALSAKMLTDLTSAARALASDDGVRAVVLRGEGSHFCAGGDLAWMRDQIAADAATRADAARLLATMLGTINDLPKPLIARIHGGAFGGGVGLACVCDVAIASDDASFGLTETRLGLIPATIGPYVVARMGEGRARRVFMSSRIFGAAEARDLGLIARAVPLVDLDAAIEAEVAPYLSTAPRAVARAKALVRSLGPRIDAAVVEDSIARLTETWEDEEAQHGLDAFLSRTKPRWQA